MLVVQILLIVALIVALWILFLNKCQIAPAKMTIETLINRNDSTYCPYRSLIGTWKSGDTVIKFTMPDSKTMFMQDVHLGAHPTCRLSMEPDVIDIEFPLYTFQIRDNKLLCMQGRAVLYPILTKV